MAKRKERDCSKCPIERIELEIRQCGFDCEGGLLEYHRGYIALLARAKQLQSELAKYRWIPVSEGLPELIDDNGYKYSSKVEIIYNGMIIEATFSEHHNQWFADYGGTTIVMSASLVTHWRPIILPPKEGEKDVD